MSLVTPAQLAAVRAVGNRGLTSTATILRSIQVESDFGSEPQWATVDNDVECWVRGTTVPSTISSAGMREVVVGTFRVHFDVGVDLLLADRLVIDGATFDVIDGNFENTIRVFTTVMAKKVE